MEWYIKIEINVLLTI